MPVSDEQTVPVSANQTVPVSDEQTVKDKLPLARSPRPRRRMRASCARAARAVSVDGRSPTP